jgi:beta-lactam-binding protein with PASTA domain
LRFFRLVTRSLILLLIALFSALTAMRFAIHGREVRVPNLRGMSTLQAQETANGNGLIVTVEDKFYSSDVPAGKIISQAPSANSKVRRGWRVRVSESLGPQRVAIPDLLGQSERAATINLRRRGLDLATVAGVAVAGVPSDQVIAQAPPPSATELTSPKVSILLAEPAATPEYVMPSFVGRQLAEAKEKIARAGLQVPIVAAAVSANQGSAVANAPVNPGPPVFSPFSGIIVSQTPPAGSRVTPDTQIRLEVSQ